MTKKIERKGLLGRNSVLNINKCHYCYISHFICCSSPFYKINLVSHRSLSILHSDHTDWQLLTAHDGPLRFFFQWFLNIFIYCISVENDFSESFLHNIIEIFLWYFTPLVEFTIFRSSTTNNLFSLGSPLLLPTRLRSILISKTQFDFVQTSLAFSAEQNIYL